MPTHERLGPDDGENLQDCWEPAIQLDKEQAIMVRELDATMRPPSQANQLMSKHRVLSFKPPLRLEWRGQDSQNETEQPDRSTSLGDSITSSTQIRFSVRTGGDGYGAMRKTNLARPIGAAAGRHLLANRPPVSLGGPCTYPASLK